MKVIKFGGTSVGSPKRMKDLATLIRSDEKRVVVLSAVSGTTNTLVEIAEAFSTNNLAKAIQIIDNLELKYIDFVNALYAKPAYKEKGIQLIASHIGFLKNFSGESFSIHSERAILAQGELMSTALFHYYLEEIAEPSVLLPALDFMRIDDDNEPVLAYIAENLKKELQKYPSNQLFITQGYICRNAFGEIDNLKRGGSDYSASLIGAALLAEEIQIWTDIDGMHNNDPRIVDRTFPIAELSFDDAAELAYFGAKILHPSSVLPAQKFNIPVRLLNTMQPQAKGTLITSKPHQKPNNNLGVIAIAAKDDIFAINIKSSRMLLAYGFLRSVFDIFERYKTSIDMITTSEVAVSLTIDNIANLDNILKELSVFSTVHVDKDLSIICIVGDFSANTKGCGFKVLETLKDIPIRMISYGGSPNNISLLINTSYKKNALNALNEGVFDWSH